ncbi:hypothetical protein GQ457_17G006060 [Hibiscus cannabinus]
MKLKYVAPFDKRSLLTVGIWSATLQTSMTASTEKESKPQPPTSPPMLVMMGLAAEVIIVMVWVMMKIAEGVSDLIEFGLVRWWLGSMRRDGSSRQRRRQQPGLANGWLECHVSSIDGY